MTQPREVRPDPVAQTHLPRGVVFIVAVSAVVMSLPGQTAGISAFTDFLIEALEITRAQLSIAYLFGTIGSAFVLTPAGRAYDRLGSRVTGTAAAAALGLSLVALTLAPRVVDGAVSVGISRSAAALTTISIGFFLVRFFGQGMMQLVGRTMIMKWFDDKRGLANAVLSSVMPLAFGAAPTMLNLLIAAHGWQGAWLILAVVLLPGFTVLAALTFADPPQGFYEDRKGTGGTAHPPRFLKTPAATARRLGFRRTGEPMRPAQDATLEQARRTLAFWIFIAVTTMSSSLLTGFTFHVVAILGETGVGREAALAILFPSAVVSVMITPIASVISDYSRLKYFAIMHGISLGFVLLSLPLLQYSRLAYLGIVLFKGLATAMFGINQAVVWPRFFGLTHLGTITGFATAWLVGGSAVGPYLYSLSFELTGSFLPVSYLFGPLCILVGLMGFYADNPNR